MLVRRIKIWQYVQIAIYIQNLNVFDNTHGDVRSELIY